MAPGHRVTLQPVGWQFTATESETLLQAALRARIGIPSSCRNGSCRACCCRLLAGRIVHTVEWPGVSREELQEGWILPCVARALTDVVLEMPDAQALDRPVCSQPGG
jgi:ferredoxin